MWVTPGFGLVVDPSFCRPGFSWAKLQWVLAKLCTHAGTRH